MAAFSSVLGPLGSYLVGIGIILFAFSSILGWEYQGEKAFEYLVRDSRCLFIYRTVYSLIVFFGATQKLDLVWNLSDITNALMAIPNLICLLLLSGEIARDVQDFQPIVEKEKNMKKKR
jgi:AGCS family alanine or glycine:cation symporter